MSSTLVMRITPKPTKNGWHFKQPIKGMFARRFYDHDGSLGGGVFTLTSDHLDWIDGVIAAGRFDDKDAKDLEAIAKAIRNGETVDMWFEA